VRKKNKTTSKVKRKLDYDIMVNKIATHILTTADNKRMTSYDVLIKFISDLREDIKKILYKHH